MLLPQGTVSASSVLARWILVSVLGFGTGIAGGVGFTLAAEKLAGVNPDRFMAYATLFCLGLTVGFIQWRVVAQFLPRSVRWVPATFIGYLLALVPFAIPRFPNLPGPELLDVALLLALMGTAIGLAQWWVLRQHYRGAAVWVLASAVGFLSFLWLDVNPTHSLTEFVLVGAALGGLAAVAQGAALAWFVRRPLATAS